MNRLSLNRDYNISKRKRKATNVYTDNDNKKIKLKHLTGRTLIHISKQKVSKAIQGNIKDASTIIDEEFKRKKSNVLKLKNAFSVENVKSISDKIHCYGKYANSDRESDESNHCQPGYGVNSSFSNESRSKKRKEKKRKHCRRNFKCKTFKNTCDK